LALTHASHRSDGAVLPTSRHRVSVVVPCFNYGRFLRDCVESVLSQDGVDVDVLIVDNASDDDSPAIASALAEADSRVSVVLHERNLGHIASFNEGLWAVDGEYAVLLCADDMLPPGSLARAAALLEAHPSVGFVYGRPVEFCAVPPPPPRLAIKSWTVWSGREWLALRCRSGVNCIRHPEVMMRSSVLRRVGGFRPELPHTGDLELWMRLSAVADVGRVNGPDQGCYRVHPQSLRRTVYGGLLTDLRQRRDAFAWTFKGPGRLVAGAGALHDSARRVLAAEALDRACRAYDRGRPDLWAPWGRRGHGVHSEIPVDELVEFACDVWPEAKRLPQWRKLVRRRRLSVRHAQLLPPFFVSAGVRRAAGKIRAMRWRRSGV